MNVETQETEEQRDKKLIRDVKHIVAKLLNNVEDMLGEVESLCAWEQYLFRKSMFLEFACLVENGNFEEERLTWRN